MASDREGLQWVWHGQGNSGFWLVAGDKPDILSANLSEVVTKPLCTTIVAVALTRHSIVIVSCLWG